jgi:hypothetical protein
MRLAVWIALSIALLAACSGPPDSVSSAPAPANAASGEWVAPVGTCEVFYFECRDTDNCPPPGTDAVTFGVLCPPVGQDPGAAGPSGTEPIGSVRAPLPNRH